MFNWFVSNTYKYLEWLNLDDLCLQILHMKKIEKQRNLIVMNLSWRKDNVLVLVNLNQDFTRIIQLEFFLKNYYVIGIFILWD